MVTIDLTEEHFTYLLTLLDSELRRGGLSSLQKVVDLNNVLASSRARSQTLETNEDTAES